MKQYHDLLAKIMHRGCDRGDRTGTGTRALFGQQMRFDLREGFPLLTTKKTSFKMIATELLWFIQGNPDLSYLHENNNHIWDEWVKEDGTFGPIYGAQWRSWQNVRITQRGVDAPSPEWINPPIDQLANVIERLKTNPEDRRLIVSAWNVADVESGEMALPPCHLLFQFFARPLGINERWVRLNKKSVNPFRGAASHEHFDQCGIPRYALSCQLYQRSCDMFLGVPYNIASYSLLTHMIANLVNMVPEEFVWTGGDCHVYDNHRQQVNELLSRDPKRYSLPTLIVNPGVSSIDDYKLSDFKVEGYECYPHIKAPIAV